MLSTKGQTLIVTCFVGSILSLSPPVKAANMSFEQILVFGNSVSDTGNLFSISRNNNIPSPPSSLYIQEQLSNESVWVDRISNNLSLDLVNFYSDEIKDVKSSLNFSIGGATAGTTSLGGTLFPGVATQVDHFIDFLDGGSIHQDALIILWAGENDYVENFLNQGTILNPEVPVNRISNAITKLVDAGAKNVLVSNLPDFGDIPLGQSLGNADELNTLTASHNSLLSLELQNISSSYSETNLILFDANSLIKEIINNPTNFGFRENHLETCLSPNNFPFSNINPDDIQSCNNPDEYIYFDNQHFTSKVHDLIADAALARIETEFIQPVPESRNIVGLITLGISSLLLWNKKKSQFF